jgi:hypothetical protein
MESNNKSNKWRGWIMDKYKSNSSHYTKLVNVTITFYNDHTISGNGTSSGRHRDAQFTIIKEKSHINGTDFQLYLLYDDATHMQYNGSYTSKNGTKRFEGEREDHNAIIYLEHGSNWNLNINTRAHEYLNKRPPPPPLQLSQPVYGLLPPWMQSAPIPLSDDDIV